MLLSSAFLFAACGSPAPTPTATCALVPNMDALVGMTAVDEPGFFNLNGFDRCVWTYRLDPSRSVGVAVGAIRGHDEGIAALGDGERIPNLGDDARWWEGNRLLSVARGGRVLQVDLQLDPAEATRDLAVAIAEAALANLN